MLPRTRETRTTFFNSLSHQHALGGLRVLCTFSLIFFLLKHLFNQLCHLRGNRVINTQVITQVSDVADLGGRGLLDHFLLERKSTNM